MVITRLIFVQSFRFQAINTYFFFNLKQPTIQDMAGYTSLCFIFLINTKYTYNHQISALQILQNKN